MYELVQKNQSKLDTYKKLWNIPEYINNVKDLSRQFSIDILGFSYNIGSIQSKVIAQTDGRNFWSVKTKNFLEYFRKQDNHTFRLDFVRNFQWQNEVTFQAQFHVK